MSWAFFAILAALVWAVGNIADKFILTKWVKNPLVILVFVAFLGLLSSVLIYFIKGFSYLPVSGAILIIATGFLYNGGNLTYLWAVQKEEISKVMPLIYLDPFFTVILAAIFINEILTPLNYLGVLFFILGVILISSKDFRFKLNMASGIAILSAFLFAITNILEKYSLASTDFWTVFAYLRIGFFLGLVIILPLCMKDLKQTLKEPANKLIYILFFQSFSIIGTLFFIIALSYGYASLTATLAAIQPLFVFILASFISVFYPKILQEKISRKILATKFVSILLIFLGTMLIL